MKHTTAPGFWLCYNNRIV